MTAEEVIAQYCAAWGEPDPSRRETLLTDVWAEGATYTDPSAHVSGRAELVELIGQVLSRFPSARVVRTSALDVHHSVARFGWKMVLADGKSLPEGIDFVEFAADGKLQRIVGFFGPLRRNE